MATSGSTDFNQTMAQLIKDALDVLNIYGIGMTVNAEDMLLCKRLLNKMLLSWATQGLRIFSKTEAVLYITPYTADYTLSNASTSAFCANKSDETITQLTTALAVSDTACTVTSTTGLELSSYIGIVLDDGTIHWTTIDTIPSSTTLTLTTGVAAAASAEAYVYSFPDRINKPYRITSARMVTGLDSGSSSSETSTPLLPIAYEDYYNLPTRSTNGTPSQYLYTPKTTTGVLSLWPRPSDASSRLEFSYERILEDLDNSSDDFDIPKEWYEPMTWQLAVRIGCAFGKEDKVRKVIMPLASDSLAALKSWDSEITSVNISPDLGVY